MEKILFWVFALVATCAGAFAVTRKRPMSCALSLVVSFVGLAGLYALQSAPFPAALQIMLYAGAIMVLVIFVIMFLNMPEDQLDHRPDVREDRFWPTFLVIPLAAVLIGLASKVEIEEAHTLPADFGSVASTGHELFETFVYPFELVSVLLLVAVVGAVVIAKKRLN